MPVPRPSAPPSGSSKDGALSEPIFDPLVERACRGDRKALDQLIRRELPKVRSLLARRLGHRDDLDDLVQMVFLELSCSLGKFREGSAIGMFVRGFARMVSMRARRPTAWERRRCPLDFEPAACGSSPEAITLAREQVRRCESALARIPRKKRIAFLLWALDGKTPHEISRLTQASLPAVRSRIFYAQKELRKEATRDPYLKELLPC